MAQATDIPELDAKGLRQFAFTMGAIIATLFGVLLPWLWNASYPVWPWTLACLFATWGAAAPTSLRPVYRAWMRFGLLLNRIMTPVILGVVFYLVITPMAVLTRIRGRDMMARSFDAESKSYRLESTRSSVQKMEKPY
ncbi:MAG: SxtJ family membrane protein [Pseudomonadota bacterium]|nr:SxtJ family membrane protein [Pseudomonadota bacterium]